LQGLPQPARERFGERPLTVLWEAVRNLVALDETIAASRGALETFADDLFAGFSDILVRLTVNHPSLCKTHSFLELAARIWRETTGTHEERYPCLCRHWIASADGLAVKGLPVC
jgi:hypothetical protein